MPITRIPKLTDGLNELANPQNLLDGGLQESVNYEILGDGKLTRRKDPVEYGDDVSGDSLKTKLAAIFTQSILQISPPLYPVKKIVDATGTRIMDGDFVILVYGSYTIVVDSVTITVYELYMCYENTTNTWDVVKVDITNITYTADTYLEFFIGDDKMIITDTYDLTTNFPHYVKIDGDGDVITGLFSIKSPTNKPTLLPTTEYNSEEFEEDVDDVHLDDCGMVQCVYTCVTKDGDESNPSPLSNSRMMQFFKKDLTDKNDIRWIDSFQITNLSVPVLTGDLIEELKYFYVYFRVIRYTEGEAAEPFYFSKRYEIVDKENNTGNTGNGYLVSVPQDESLLLSYENDIAPFAKHAAETAGIVGLANIREKVRFPFNFEKYCPILINNINNKNFVDAVVQIRIYDENNVGTLDNNDEQVDFIDDLDLTYYNYVGQSFLTNLNKIRIYDDDLTTPIKVFYDTYNGAAYIDVYIKVPLLTAGQTKYLYLCFNTDGDATEEGVNIEDRQTAEYGEFTQRTDTSLFDTERVKSNKTVICSPMDYMDGEEVINLADSNNNGEITGDSDENYWEAGVTKQLITQDAIGTGRVFLSSGTIKYDEMPFDTTPDKIAIWARLDYAGLNSLVNNPIFMFRETGILALGLVFIYDENDEEYRFSLSTFAAAAGTFRKDLIFDEIPVAENGDLFICLSINKGENASLFVGNLTTGSYYHQEVEWDEWTQEPADDFWEGLDYFVINHPYASTDFQFYVSQFQFTINKYYSATSDNDLTAIYNIANFMPGYEAALGNKIIQE